MQEAPYPQDEVHRQDVVRNLHLLDTPIEERFDRITRMLSVTLDMPMAHFTLMDDARFWLKSTHGMGDMMEGPRRISFCSHAMAGNDDVMLVEDARTDNRFHDNPAVTGAPFVTAYAGCTVKAPDGTRVGTLCALDTKPRQLTHDQIQMLRDMAAIVETELRASMLSKSQHDLITELESAKRLALIDPLTRIWNRKGIDELLAREWAKAERDGSELSIAIVDIDHFKKVNDTYGHPVGDEILRTTVKNLLAALRPQDIVGRMGGEEFMIVMPLTENDVLQSVLDRLCKTIAAAPVVTKDLSIDVTISIGGVSVRPADSQSEDASEVIAQADAALYAAKNRGRNRAVAS